MEEEIAQATDARQAATTSHGDSPARGPTTAPPTDAELESATKHRHRRPRPQALSTREPSASLSSNPERRRNSPTGGSRCARTLVLWTRGIRKSSRTPTPALDKRNNARVNEGFKAWREFVLERESKLRSGPSSASTLSWCRGSWEAPTLEGKDKGNGEGKDSTVKSKGEGWGKSTDK